MATLPLLSAGKLRGNVIHAIVEADTLEQGGGAFAAKAGGKVRGGVGQGIMTCSIAVVGSRLKLWKTKPILRLRSAALIGGKRDFFSIEPVFAGRTIEAAEDVHERAFS